MRRSFFNLLQIYNASINLKHVSRHKVITIHAVLVYIERMILHMRRNAFTNLSQPSLNPSKSKHFYCFCVHAHTSSSFSPYISPTTSAICRYTKHEYTGTQFAYRGTMSLTVHRFHNFATCNKDTCKISGG